jgi:PAS domain-containing protein
MLLKFGQATEEDVMIDASFMSALVDSLKDPVLVADTEHKILYMNRAAVAHYEEGESLLGRSLLECHNERSCHMIVEILAAMQQEGLEERLITDDEEHRIFMRAVRGPGGRLLGYYERYEPPAPRQE